MSKINLPKVTHKGQVHLNGFDIECYNLDNGERVLSRTGFVKALGRQGKVKGGRRYDNESQVPVFLTANNLKQLVSDELLVDSKPLIFKDSNGNEAMGYKASLLPEVAYVFAEALDKGILKPNQLHIGKECKILVKAFLKISIIALVDEATGYQDVRDKAELKSFLKRFLLEEKTKHVDAYPDEFFESMFKMRGLTWSKANRGKNPQYFGHYINNYVYSRLGPEVLFSLRKLNPKKENGTRGTKHYNYTSAEYGFPKLKEHLNILTAFAKASGYNWTNWTRMIERAFPKYNQDGSTAPELPFEDND